MRIGKKLSALIGLCYIAGCNSPQSLGTKFVKSESITASQGGTLAVSGSDDSALSGTTIVIPAGALGSDTTITVAEGNAVPLPTGGSAAGPVADFGPSGTLFSHPVTITLPYVLPSGKATTTLAVVAVETDSHSTIPNAMLTINSTAGTVSFAVNGFTSFGCISSPTPNGDGGTVGVHDGGVGDATVTDGNIVVTDGGVRDATFPDGGPIDGPIVCNCPSVPTPNCGTTTGPGPCFCPIANACPDFGSTCIIGGGQCVAVVPGACANGIIGDPNQYSCGSGVGVECCLPSTPPPHDAGPACGSNLDCSAGMTCVSGVCVGNPPPVDAGPGPDCGLCGAVCRTDADCSLGLTCVSGQCIGTPPPPKDAGPSCNADSDCSLGLTCVSGQCIGTPPPPKDAGAACSSDGDCVSSQICVSGVCTLPPPPTDGGVDGGPKPGDGGATDGGPAGECADDNDCGGGDNVCVVATRSNCGPFCSTTCLADSDCGGGQTCQTFVDTDGQSTMACAPASGPVCSGGTMTCTQPQIMCGATCVDLQSDVQNCGSCGTACPSGFNCNFGACMCPSGQTMCGLACIDLQSDAQNCGACGESCPSQQSCRAGVCQ